MRVPLSWLRDFVDVELTPEQLAERLTLLGMEVKHIERWGADWESVVIGELLTVERHPRADRLSLTTVTLGDGSEPLSIVCGATNIAPGQRIPVALPGAVLPGNRRIERAEKMGVVSQRHAVLGRRAAAHRRCRRHPDPAGGHAARRSRWWTCTATSSSTWTSSPTAATPCRSSASRARSPRPPAQQVRMPEIAVEEGSGPSTAERLAVEIRDPDLCTRLRRPLGERRDRSAPSPDAVQMRLLAAGQRPISNVVDVSNYVMLELGKPIHTFDAAAVRPGADGRATIVVRRATAGRAPRDAGPRGARARGGHAAHRRSGGAARRRRRHGRRQLRGVRRDARHRHRVGHLRPRQHPAHRAAARPPLGGVEPLREGPGAAHGPPRRGPHGAAHPPRGPAARSPRASWTPPRTCPGRRASRSARRASTACSARSCSIAEQRDAARPRRRGDRAGAGRCARHHRAQARDRWSSAADEEAITAIVPTWRRDIAIEADVAEEIARVRGYELDPVGHARHRDARLPCLAARDPGARPRDARRRRPHGGRDDGPRLAQARRDVRARARGARRSGDEDQPGGDADRRDQPAVARPLAAAPQPAGQPPRRRGRQPAPRHGGRRGVRDRQGLRPDRRRAARVVAPRLRARRRRRAGRLEPHGPAVRPRRRQGRSWSCWRAAWACPPSPTRPRPARRCSTPVARPGRTPAIGCTRSSARCTRTSSTPGSCGPPTGSSSPRSPSTGSPPGAPRARSAPMACPASPRWTATSRSSCPRPSCRRRRGPRSRARGRPAARRPPVRHLPRGAARRRTRRASRSASGSAPRTGRCTEAEVETAVAGVVGRAARGRRPSPGLRSRALGCGYRVGRSSRCGALRRAATLRRGTGRRGFRQPSRGWMRGHRWVHHIAEPVRPGGHPVPGRDVRPGLHPGIDPAGGRHRCRIDVLVLPRRGCSPCRSASSSPRTGRTTPPSTAS